MNKEDYLHELKEIATLRMGLISLHKRIQEREEKLFNDIYFKAFKENTE